MLVFSCNKVEMSDIPYARVFFEVDLQFKDKELSAPGTLICKTFTQARNAGEATGYSGILVVSGFDGHYAYDLCCPFEAKRAIKVEPTDVGTAVCPECGTVYDISRGSGHPTSGPSHFALVRFNVSPVGQRLIIQY